MEREARPDNSPDGIQAASGWSPSGAPRLYVGTHNSVHDIYHIRLTPF